MQYQAKITTKSTNDLISYVFVSVCSSFSFNSHLAHTKLHIQGDDQVCEVIISEVRRKKCFNFLHSLSLVRTYHPALFGTTGAHLLTYHHVWGLVCDIPIAALLVPCDQAFLWEPLES